jgi:CP family cyanate transporter-like MFS transporter
MSQPSSSRPSRSTAQLFLLLAGLVLLAVNLRPAAVSVGPVLAEVRAGLSLSGSEAGLLTSLPVLAFAAFGAAAPAVARRVGLHRTTMTALLALVTGLAGRAFAPGEATFLVLSMLALSGMAMANVLLPSLVKLHFPDRIGRVTALYTGALSVGLTAALMLTVPLAGGGEEWRWGLGAWAVPALLAAVPWLWLVAHDRRPDQPVHDVTLGQVAHTRLGWAMALFFGLQSMQAYAIFGWFAQLWRDAGYSPTAAGVLVGLVAATSIPLSLWLPAVIARQEHPRGVLLAVIACYPLAYVALILAPHGLALPAAVVVGVGTCTFPLILTLIGLRARTPGGTAALSGFTQSAGYLLAALGPFCVGVLHDASGGWTVPLLFLIALTVPQLLLGSYVSRPAAVEDQLHRASREPV